MKKKIIIGKVLKKCECWFRMITFIGHNIYKEMMSMDLAKVEAINDLPKLTIVNKVWSFL